MTDDDGHEAGLNVFDTLLMPLRLPGRVVADIGVLAEAVVALQSDAKQHLSSVDERAGVLVDGLHTLQASIERIDAKVEKLEEERMDAFLDAVGMLQASISRIEANVEKLESLEESLTLRIDGLRTDLNTRMIAVERTVGAMTPPMRRDGRGRREDRRSAARSQGRAADPSQGHPDLELDGCRFRGSARDRLVHRDAAGLAALRPAAASAAVGEYTQCGAGAAATLVAVSGAACDEALAIAQALSAAGAGERPELLRAAGWTPLRAASLADGSSHDLVAIRGRAALRMRFAGAAPDLDGLTAGRELFFSRARFDGEGRMPRSNAVCTSAFLLRLGGHLGALSAAHCGGVRSDGTTQRRNVMLRRPPQPGSSSERSSATCCGRRPLDALVIPVPSGPTRPVAAVVDRGVSRPPWFVIGSARPLGKRRVCLTGRTSGVDQCGMILFGTTGRRLDAAATRSRSRVVCTSIIAREGDSGGPVYTRPGAAGTVRAVGVTTLVLGLFQTMCFTPISPVLDALNARLLTAPAA